MDDKGIRDEQRHFLFFSSHILSSLLHILSLDRRASLRVEDDEETACLVREIMLKR